MEALGTLLLLGLDIYLWIIIIWVVASWLLAFGVINTRNPQAENLVRLLNKATDPVMRPIQKFIPPIAGIDISPIIVILGIYLLRGLVYELFMTQPI